MLTFLLAAAIGYTLRDKNVLQPPQSLPLDGSGTVSGHYPFVLFFYGSNEDLVHEEARLAWLRDSLHVNAICFDFPGYGFSTGRVAATKASAGGAKRALNAMMPMKKRDGRQ